MDLAYSAFRIKSLNEERRILTGIATTPGTDRAGDIVEPKGAEFELPLPFLWQHDPSAPIGHVTRAKVTAKGIEVEVQLARCDEPGTLKDRLDEAWHSLKLGLVRGLSVGFKAIETARIEGSHGVRFIKWAWLELSAVTVPANVQATVANIKRFDANPVRTPMPRLLGREASADYVEPEIVELDARWWSLFRKEQALQGEDGSETRRSAYTAAMETVTGEIEARRKQLSRVLAGQPAEEPALQVSAPRTPAPIAKSLPPGARESIGEFGKNLGDQDLLAPPARLELCMIANLIKESLEDISDRLDAVEGGGLKYAGTWQRALAYTKGDVITHEGSAWIALKAAEEGSRPGASPEHWQLMVKAGKDAR